MKRLIFPWLIIAGLVWLSSCQHKDDVSLHGHWELAVSKIFEVEEESFAGVDWIIEADGSFLQLSEGPGGSIERTARWEYEADSGQLHIMYDLSGNDVTWIVTELGQDSLYVEYTGYGFFVERIFVRKK